jgi:hypothetical protein
VRAGFIISGIVHAGAMWVLVFAGADPFDFAPTQAIAVDIVSENEIDPAASESLPSLPLDPDASKPSLLVPSEVAARAAPGMNFDPKPLAGDTTFGQSPPAPQSATAPRPAAAPAPPAQQRDPAQAGASQRSKFDPSLGAAAANVPPAAEAANLPNPAAPDFAGMFGMPLALPDGRLGGGFDAPATDAANLAQHETASFREHLRSCATLPASLVAADKIKIVLRVSFKSDGTLAAPPSLIEGTGSAVAKGLALMQAATSALRRCQPYAMLPSDRYNEWKVLDLTFTPQDFAEK